MSKSIFGSIQYLGPDHYRAYWTEPGGIRRSKVVHGSRDEAELLLAERRLARTGEVPDMPWGRFWERTVVPSFDGLAERTVHDYERLWRTELAPRIGSRMVSATTWSAAQAVLADVEAPSTQAHCMRLLRKMCNMAVRDGLLQRNPVDRTIRLKRRNRREKHMVDAADVAAFLGAVRGIKYEPVILLELGAGLSHEEACGMTWECTEAWESGGRTYLLARVERALTNVGSKKVLKETKNGFRERECVVGEPFAGRLLELRGTGPVCRGPLLWRPGEELATRHFASPGTITHNWKVWCGRHGMGYVRPGDMRSVYATWHGEAGSPDSLVSMSMGHSDGTTRGRNYQMHTRRGMALIADMLTDYLDGLAPSPGEDARAPR